MPRVYPRYLDARLREELADTPAVLIHGPRQSGKTTLARAVGERRGYRYFSFDDEPLRRSAKQDPVGFVAGLSFRLKREFPPCSASTIRSARRASQRITALPALVWLVSRLPASNHRTELEARRVAGMPRDFVAQRNDRSASTASTTMSSARSISRAVVVRPREKRAEPEASAGEKPIATSTCEGLRACA